MGELLKGRPALVLDFAAPVALDTALALSLVYRAAAGTEDAAEFAPWVRDTAAALPAGFAEELCLLLGFGGPALYYLEELTLALRPPDRAAADDEDFPAALDRLARRDAASLQRLAVHAIRRVYADRNRPAFPPAAERQEPRAWRTFVAPALTTARVEDASALLADPEQLRERTLALCSRFWDEIYAAERARHRPLLAAAVARGQAAGYRDLALAFAETTGKRLPQTLRAPHSLDDVARVTFCPSPHLGAFLSLVHYPPELVIFFDAHRFAGQPAAALAGPPPADDLLARAMKALADETRLRIVRLLAGGELYAQEIVGQLGSVSQSAVSRHLGVLEDAGIVTVRPASGMKYYALDRTRLRDLGRHLERLGA
ncbi:MAG TPA: metalloregulator ArsR/SmtB family transcription factor [Thermomicrobiales bacterium]|nr:metalloregulator ArsR/SmtB family transcription factor [Thermomicrobiales bacterium]